jgi:hypothetical protein
MRIQRKPGAAQHRFKLGKNKRRLLPEQFAQSMVNDGCIYILADNLRDVEDVL